MKHRVHFAVHCALAVCYFNEAMFPFENNEPSMCTEEDFQKGEPDVFVGKKANTKGIIKPTIVVIDEPEDFMRFHDIGGVPLMRLYKPNGEILDYLPNIVGKYFSNTMKMYAFFAETVFGESMYHPCLDFLVSEWRNTSYYPGVFGLQCGHRDRHLEHPFRARVGQGYNTINAVWDKRSKKSIPLAGDVYK